MNRKELEALISLTYSVEAEHLWLSYPDFAVFRHPVSRKWFALCMDIPVEKLGLAGDGTIGVVNVKCDPILIGSLRAEPGFFPAYHMNKTSWISIALDGTVDAERIKWLLDMSYDLTAPRSKRKKI